MKKLLKTACQSISRENCLGSRSQDPALSAPLIILQENLCLWQRLSATFTPTSIRLYILTEWNTKFTQYTTSMFISAVIFWSAVTFKECHWSTITVDQHNECRDIC